MTDPKELGRALKEGATRIEVEGDLVKKVKKIHSIGVAAWAICAGALTVAIAAAIAAAIPDPLEPVEGVVGLVSGGLAAGILGSAAPAAIAIGSAAGGVGGLNKLRGYKIEKVSKDKIILVQKANKLNKAKSKLR